MKSLLAIAAVAFIAIQFVPVERTNPLGAGDPDVSVALQWTFRRACYDCHSNETRWPVWAYVAPMSWLVVSDVEAAREMLNFSEWAGYEPATRVALRSMVGPTTAIHRMPAWHYISLHPDAALSESEFAAVSAWSSSAASEAAIPAIQAPR